MKIAATSDLHGFFPEIPDGVDVCLIAGDIVAATGEAGEKRSWIEFGHWLGALTERRIVPVGIAGNHDFLLERAPDFAHELPWVYLCDSGIEFGGVKFWGTPWQPYFGNYAFNAPEFDSGEEFLTEKFAQIPDDTDVLIAHGPPLGFHDRIGRKNVGSKALNRRIQEVMPKLAVYGHIHHGYGAVGADNMVLANVSHTAVVKNRYVPANKPMTFEI